MILLFWITVSIFIINIISHIVTAYIVHQTELSQKEYLINISFAEVLLSLWSIFECFGLKYQLQERLWYQSIMLVLYCSLCVIYLLTMMALIVDRFLSIYYHLRYAGLFVKRKVKLVIACLWLIGTFILVAFELLLHAFQLEYRKTVQIVSNYILIPLDVLLILLLVIVYTYFATVRNRMAHESSYRQVLIPAMITMTFVLFAAVPDAIGLAVQAIDQHILLLLYSLLYFSDAMIILVFNRMTRRWVVKWTRNNMTMRRSSNVHTSVQQKLTAAL